MGSCNVNICVCELNIKEQLEFYKLISQNLSCKSNDESKQSLLPVQVNTPPPQMMQVCLEMQ